MIIDYESKYFEFVQKGLEETVYKIKGIKKEKKIFFDELISLTNVVKKSTGRMFFMGNGASASFSNHMALDWSKNGGVYATSLSDSALLTALSNDYSYEMAFVEYLKINKVNENDIVVTISSSGNSKNITNVLKFCCEIKVKTIGFSGLNPDNKTTELSDYSLFVPCKTYGFVECIHQVFLHLWLDKYMGIYEWNRDSVQNMDRTHFKL